MGEPEFCPWKVPTKTKLGTIQTQAQTLMSYKFPSISIEAHHNICFDVPFIPFLPIFLSFGSTMVTDSGDPTFATPMPNILQDANFLIIVGKTASLEVLSAPTQEKLKWEAWEKRRDKRESLIPNHPITAFLNPMLAWRKESQMTPDRPVVVFEVTTSLCS